jgi:hypothetical protein
VTDPLSPPDEAGPFKVIAPVDLQKVVAIVLRRAERQGHILPREIRQELARVGADEEQWREVLAAAGPALERHGNRYAYVPPPPSPPRKEQEQRFLAIREAVHALAEHFKQESARHERREADRITFVHPVTIRLPTGEPHHAITKDLSASGIRLIGTRDLLSQKVEVTLKPTNAQPVTFAVRVVWTHRVGDDLYENGGVFMDVKDPGAGGTG